jgi:formimidoylglutamate deiminase
LECGLAGGAAAAGCATVGLRVGARADLLLVNTADPALAGVDGDRLLDALVFAAPARPFAAALVAGRWRDASLPVTNFASTLRALA